MIIGGRAHNVAEALLIGKTGLPFAELSILDENAFYDVELDALRKISDTYGLRYLAHGPEEGNAWEPDVLRKKFLPRILKLLTCLGELSIKLFTIHFWMDKRFIDGRIIDEKIGILKEMVACASDQGVQLCIENLSEHASDFLSAFDAVDDLGMTLDIGHGELLTEKNTAFEFSGCCPEKIFHVHVHDNYGGNGPENDLHLAPGDGSIDFASILPALKTSGFDQTMTLEIKPGQLARGKKIIEGIW